MEEILKQDKSKSHKEFEKLLTEDLESRKFKEGEITTGTVEEIGIKARVSNSIKDAVKYVANKDENSVIFIVGSIFLIGEVLNLS